MSDQPGDVLDEAAKLVDTLIRRVGEVTGGGRDRRTDRHTDREGAAGDGDVWSRVTAEQPTDATGASDTASTPDAASASGTASTSGPEGAPVCRGCPICRAKAIRRETGGDLGRHLHDAGRSLLAAALDVVAAFDRTATGRTGRDRPPEASARPSAGRSERSDRREKGEPWSAATGGDPTDIG
ncbi:hypothetical protein BZB76_3148 [Actinomadura pelletieri DSM 43383]|uniref:Uncharacterized protein n=1 Tax=Actinomadura pelletieri DSM 43383 TaxID=1120940 RepID=A0A495QNW5_9ACTN|nr:hypothetical protein [Actinomadura pelletieri]RKS74631.1 hypothetical protein BZB76_3148 [Actinomadura pelletieri DSM 43383]